MTQTIPSPSTPPRASSADWPPKALPEHWLDSLFSRMEASYGSRFADMWGGTDLRAVKRQWAIDLCDLSPEELRAGVAALRSCDWPPSLPEFRKLCRPGRAYRSSAQALPPPAAKASPERVAAALEQVRALQPEAQGKAWAVRLLERHKRGEKIAPSCVEMARRALRMEGQP
ncbi:hypothetical protein [Cupriavidus necator]